MRIREVHVQRVKNLGNYENQKIGMTALLDESEDAEAAAGELEDRVRVALGQPTRAQAAARKVVVKADALWAQARREASQAMDKEVYATTVDADRVDRAEELRKASAECLADYKKSATAAEAEERRQDVAEARAVLGQKPKRVEDINLDEFRRTWREEYGLNPDGTKPAEAAPAAGKDDDEDGIEF